MRFAPECDHGGNAGLGHARDWLETVKAKHPNISYADLYIFAGKVPRTHTPTTPRGVEELTHRWLLFRWPLRAWVAQRLHSDSAVLTPQHHLHLQICANLESSPLTVAFLTAIRAPSM